MKREWSLENLRQEADTIKKLNAFSYYKERGESGMANYNLKKYLDFCKENEHKSKEELEKELFEKLNS